MSFQHFRLHPLTAQTHAVVPTQSQSSLSQALGPQPPPQQPQASLLVSRGGPTLHIQQVEAGLNSKKAPYGSGDVDDGYTLTFPSMQAFNEWRHREEEEQVVEFVKGDTHGSKAVPPRFKEHTKLVCARHTRSGRKKYVKKYPDRVRKVPSRKIDFGCPASISYKTYFDTEEVRVCYIPEHSHEIGIANLPFTKRGRRAQAEQDQAQEQADNGIDTDDSQQSTPPPSISLSGPSSPPPQIPITHVPQPQTFQSAMSMYASAPPPQQQQQQQPLPPPQPQPQPQPQPPPQMQHTPQHAPPPQHQHAPQQHAHVPQPQSAPIPQAHPPISLMQERWDRMSVLFQGIRDNARSYDYPAPSVAALESILIRLYLESPMTGGMGMNGG